eukprot:362094-Chlamydomonas_euryale.AAC.13
MWQSAPRECARRAGERQCRLPDGCHHASQGRAPATPCFFIPATATRQRLIRLEWEVCSWPGQLASHLSSPVQDAASSHRVPSPQSHR